MRISHTDEKYYRYNRTQDSVEAGYPRPLTDWRGLPPHIDAAAQGANGRTYFFSGTDYWRYDDVRSQVNSLSSIRSLLERELLPVSDVHSIMYISSIQ